MQPTMIHTQPCQDFMNSQTQQQFQCPQPQQPQQPKVNHFAEMMNHPLQMNNQRGNPQANPNGDQHSHHAEWNANPPQPQGSSMYPFLPPLPPMKPMMMTTNVTPQQLLTQGFTSTTVTCQQHGVLTFNVPPPDMEQKFHLVQLESNAKRWLYQRRKVIEMLQSLVNDLNRVATNTTKTKIGGTATNIVGTGLLVGGIVAAPFTFGSSLLASAAGIGLVGAGTAVTVGSSIAEWKHAKKMAKLIQIELEKDTQEMNEMLRQIYEYRSYDTYLEYRTLNFDNCQVTVMQFVNALVGNGKSTSHQSGCITSGKLTHGNAGATSLVSLLIKGAIPVVSIPVDMCLLVQESKKLNDKEPSKLAGRVIPVIEALRMQTQLATGQII
ncbi:hypothetical protein FDP41_001341 [Naegleria fowleri]|uniref:Uncharacterized protein n=1 Tax=Naegleria fowleri TaxID=5763 RepID=A0A6A5BNT8_NAEFO|nr:uncharacterized protein FDP41_001341 [Naegleria fowleri]KAF0979673.1 hypothetical protein FDP41_001341 [Naegleria fowleri]